MLNPFEPLSPERLAAIYHWPPLALRFLSGDGDCLHVMGQAGMGKTTLLRQIELRISEAGQQVPYTCVPPGGTSPARVAFGDVTLVDEADRMSGYDVALTLLEVKLLRGRIVLGTHRNLMHHVRACGMSGLEVALRPLRDADALAELLLDRAQLAGAAWCLDSAARRALLHHSRGNTERALQIGYEVFEDLETPAEITSQHITAAAGALDRATAPPPPPPSARR